MNGTTLPQAPEVKSHTLTLTLPELARWIRAVDRLASRLDEAGARGLTETTLAALTPNWAPLTEILVMNKRAVWRMGDVESSLVSDMFAAMFRNADGTYRIEADEIHGDAA